MPAFFHCNKDEHVFLEKDWNIFVRQELLAPVAKHHKTWNDSMVTLNILFVVWFGQWESHDQGANEERVVFFNTFSSTQTKPPHPYSWVDVCHLQ